MRRVRRIAPALLATIALTCVGASLVLLPSDLGGGQLDPRIFVEVMEAIARIDPIFERYVYASRKVSPQVLNQVARAQNALSEYKSLLERSRGMQWRFNLMLVVVSLLRTVNETVPANAPAMVFYDVQTEQIDTLRETLQASPGLDRVQTAPLVLGRLVAVNGESLRDSADGERAMEARDEQKLSNRAGNIDDVVIEERSIVHQQGLEVKTLSRRRVASAMPPAAPSGPALR